MKRGFYSGLLLGVLLASCAFLVREHYARTIPPTASAHLSKGGHDEPQSWLLPEGFTLAQIYTEPDALFVLSAPDATTIHRAAADGFEVLGKTFAADGISPTPEDAKILHATLHALNAYTVGSACAFQPGVLVRMSRGDHHLDLLICFTCEDIVWVLDGGKTDGFPAGLSDLGVGSLRTVFRHAFPEDPAFKSGE